MLKIAYHPCYAHPLPEGHRFPMEKYRLLPEQLLYENTCTEVNFFQPKAAQYDDIALVHTSDYIQKLESLSLSYQEARAIGFPVSKALVEREKIIAQGTITGAMFALKTGIAFNIAGGTHHAYRNHGEAFCLYNDQAIAAQYLLNNNLAKQILIVDLDVHQGNGTAEIFSENPQVFTCSMHGKNNYPFRKEHSDLDIELPNNTDDSTYLKELKNHLPRLVEQLEPDFIFYLSGVDILASDKLGKLGCSLTACKERDKYVLSLCKNNHIPVQCSMGGGYSADIKTIIEAHANTYRIAQELFF
ncbi:MAG: histone deacetylase [Flavobacteriaceae bacterium]|nr:histone deacetylase [Flavobacteriaceae bacterium]